MFLILLASFVASAAEESCSLLGTWLNQLGSRMAIDVSSNGVLSGTYTSKVSSTGESAEGTLSGHASAHSFPVFGITVVWPMNYGSVTTWTGQCRLSDQGRK